MPSRRRQKQKKKVKRREAKQAPDEVADASQYTSWEEAKAPRLHAGAATLASPLHSNEDSYIIKESLPWFDAEGNERDISCFAMIDGHSSEGRGAEASTLARDHLAFAITYASCDNLADSMKDAFLAVDRKICDHALKTESDTGCCATVAVIRGQHLCVANAGDCRAILCTPAEQSMKAPPQVLALSSDHNASVEKERSRIQRLAGYIEDDRVFGILQPTRGLGDAEVKTLHLETLQERQQHLLAAASTDGPTPTPASAAGVASGVATTKAQGGRHRTGGSGTNKGKAKATLAIDTWLRGAKIASIMDIPPSFQVVSPIPECTHFELDLPTKTSPKSSPPAFLVMATDGVWDVMSNRDAAAVVSAQLLQSASPASGCTAAAEQLCQTAQQRGSLDDITAVVVCFS